MRRLDRNGTAALAAMLLLTVGAPGLTGCVKDVVVNPTVAVAEEEKENFVTRGSSVSMVVETAKDLFFKYKNDLWRLDKNTDHMERLRRLGEKESSGPIWVYNNNLYYTVTEEAANYNETKRRLYNMNLETKKEQELSELSFSPSGIYVSDGLLYLEGYNQRKIYKLSEQGAIEGEAAAEETVYGLIPEDCTALFGDSLPYIVERYGYMPLTNGENLVIADQNGQNVRRVPTVHANSGMLFSEDAIYAVLQEEKGYSCQRIDVNTLEVTTVFETEHFPTLLQYRDGSLYYMESSSYTLAGGDTYFYRVDTKTTIGETVVTLEHKPGTGNFYDFYGNFYVTDTMIYSEMIEDYGVYMARSRLSEVTEQVVIEIPLYQSEIGSLGGVEAEMLTIPCSCGELTAAEVYVERLNLSAPSDAAAAINTVLTENFEKQLSLGPVFSEADESMIHNESYSPYSLTYQVGEIHYLDERYLCFEMDGYAYTGGAHGMPYRDSYLFDLQTGQRLGLSDILDSSEEELKTLVSTYFKELSEQTGFSFASPEELEQEVWGSVTMESPFYMTKEGLVFYYPPYEIAAYAAGFPEVMIPYGEITMKIQF